ncbi:XRN1, SEP1, KEM1, 5'-3' exoribonuclease 1 [Babesia microti strain RI]|uniref:XRN1, SEP1, KEM1, 5'-3' exoribonuclease 1 n=1 Tax=Babesia microti (strain RI) TaxID=1133968 RepID=I7IPR2_BABMR|nr:XRN1, SEP1, KEM1, 5'-3' exoribonuclease 1 [Babesia microti strain RI]CCF73155.1 XRN1, SEP1, KEM1, 5'-3' exoribonuclease 1 [Babesia microti strain RI]|eukprot:XP_012647764.1 XRN1, SEP1, KEM1, 5'-3' exoribonuclease 1 [Babesia microti strain RI]
MGVGHFFRYIAERYPLICQQISRSFSDNEAALSEFYSDSTLPFDALYLDMNGIVHICAYSNKEFSRDISSLGDIWLSIFQYITKIVNLAKPKKLLYLAVDGVAPKAKMNQQRTRRFRSVAESEQRANLNEECAKYFANGYDDPVRGKDGFVFDPTCITPGTKFMHEFTTQIEKYVAKMIKADTYWSKLKVIVSGANVPGEGEHKIAEYIRNTKGQSIKSHCIYGLDADLIMLSLLFHEPHICLLRESIIFTNMMKNNITYRLLPKDDNFVLLHIRVLREYLARELLPVHMLKEPFISRAIDDFILICLLVGNDFLPHLKFVQIPNRGLTILMKLYREHVGKNQKNPWLTIDCGEIDLRNFCNFLDKYCRVETKQILEKLRDPNEHKPTLIDTARHKIEKDYTTYSRMFPKPATTPDQWASRYYYAKMGLTDEQSREEIVKQYLIGIQWVLYYYYRCVPDWNWYLPCPYPPLAQDMSKILKRTIQKTECKRLSKALGIKFELGHPCTPFEQLLSVLPPKSSYLLPKQLEALITDPKSGLESYFPTQFDVDMDDTLVPWGGVTLLPTIDPTLIRQIIHNSLQCHPLDKADEQRNEFGQAHLIFQCNSGKVIKRKFRNPGINGHFDNTMRYVESSPVNSFWFPSIAQLRHQFQFSKGVNVFSRPSQHESMYIYPQPIIRGKISQHALVGYPYPSLVQVYKIFTPSVTFNLSHRKFTQTDPDHYEKVAEQLRFQYHVQGICLQSTPSTGAIDFLASLFSVDLDIFRTNQDCPDAIENTFISFRRIDRNLGPYGGVEYHNISFARFVAKQKSSQPSLSNLDGCKVVLIRDGPLFGSVGKLSISEQGAIATFFSGGSNRADKDAFSDARDRHHWLQAMALKILISSKNSKWYGFETLCAKAGITSHVGELILGSLEINLNGIRHDIGMGLCTWNKSHSNEGITGILCLPGYANSASKYSESSSDRPCCYSCIYSHDAFKALKEYKRLFPQLFDYISRNESSRINAANVFQYVTNSLDPEAHMGRDHAIHLGKNIVAWCEEQPFKILKFVSGGYSALPSATIAEIARLHDSFIREHQPTPSTYSTSDLDSVYSAEFDKYPSLKSPNTVSRLQRRLPCIGQYVVNLYQGGPVPVGARAIVTGIFPEKESTLLEICLVDTFFGASTCHGRTPKLRGLTTTPDHVLSLQPFVTWDSAFPFLDSALGQGGAPQPVAQPTI